MTYAPVFTLGALNARRERTPIPAEAEQPSPEIPSTPDPGAGAGSPPVLPVTWERLPEHPSISAHPSAGRHILAMVAHGDYVLVGYGDWNANTGPVDVIGYFAKDGTPVTFLSGVRNEAFSRIRILDGAAYLPKIDPKEGWSDPRSGGFATDEGGTWHVEACGPMIHTFDVIKFGGDLYTCGSSVSQVDPTTGSATLFRRRNGVWSEVLRGSETGDGARFYTMWIDGDGRLCTAEPLPVGGVARVWRTTDGLAWTDTAEPRDMAWFASADTFPLYPYTNSTVTAGGYKWCYEYTTKSVARIPI